MANVNVHIWHNVNGHIVAVGRPMGGAKCTPVAGENQSVIETHIEEKQIARLHETHFVDAARKLVVRPSDYKK